MRVGYRLFVIEGDSIVRLSQATFYRFFSREQAVLPQYTGRVILVAIAAYELRDRKPARVLRIDTRRLKVTASGSLNKRHYGEALRLAANRIGPPGETNLSVTVRRGNVMDATAVFDERRWQQLHPELPGPVIKKILAALFGVA